MKHKNFEVEREKKVRRVLKGTDKVSKHRKTIYNILDDYEIDDYTDEEENYNDNNDEEK